MGAFLKWWDLLTTAILVVIVAMQVATFIVVAGYIWFAAP